MLGQLGRGNLLAISGGRVVIVNDDLVSLPVSNGYSVEVELDVAHDTYTVRRVFRRGTKVWIKGERTNVYCDELGETAYVAHAFRSYDETEWPAEAASRA